MPAIVHDGAIRGSLRASDGEVASSAAGHHCAVARSIRLVPDASPGSIGVQPGQANTGGVSFDIRPADAQIYVDGEYVGVVGDFLPTSQPLTLSAGRHRIELRGAGYEPLVFDADIAAGEVIPYQGAMQLLRRY